MIHRTCARACLGVLLLAPALSLPCAAQEVAPVASESACATFARVLGAARRSGAVERVVGLHPFIMTRRFFDEEGRPRGERRFLMTYRIALDEGRGTLALDVVVRPEGAPGQVDIGYVVGLEDGRLRSMRAVTADEVSGVVEDGRLRLRVNGAAREEPWDDAILPKIVAAFVLPMLADQGLPERVELRDLNPFGDVTRTIALRALHEPDDPGRTFGTDEGRPRPTTRVRTLPGGETPGADREPPHRVASIHTESEVTAAGVVVHLAASERISREEHERLSPTWQRAR